MRDIAIQHFVTCSSTVSYKAVTTGCLAMVDFLFSKVPTHVTDKGTPAVDVMTSGAVSGTESYAANAASVAGTSIGKEGVPVTVGFVKQTKVAALGAVIRAVLARTVKGTSVTKHKLESAVREPNALGVSIYGHNAKESVISSLSMVVIAIGMVGREESEPTTEVSSQVDGAESVKELGI